MGVNRILLLSADARLLAAAEAAFAGTGWDIEVRVDPLWQAPAGTRRFSCTLIDLEVLPDAEHLAIACCIRHHPVILVASAVPELLREWVVAHLSPRSVGPLAADTVRRAIARP